MHANYTSKIFLFLFLFCNGFCTSLYSQETKDSIASRIENYFTLDREKIHLQFSKNKYFTNESVTFQGYCYHLQKGEPSTETTNVLAVLYNGNGEKITEKLFYASNGYFDGAFALNESMLSGNYYVHVFTNWMNNFAEDESSLFKLLVINNNDANYPKETTDLSQVEIQFYPESGKIISGITNVIGLKINDCHGNALSNSEVNLIDANGKTIKNISLNKFGYGKFELLPTQTNCKIKVSTDDLKLEKYLPAPSAEGIALEVNSFTLKDKIAIKLKSNAETMESLTEKPLYLVLNQFGKATVMDIELEPGQSEKLLFFNPIELPYGVNTVRIIDNDMNMLAERLFFNYSGEKLQFEIEKSLVTEDSIDFKANSHSNTVIGISVVPEESTAIEENSDIQGTFLLKPFLSENFTNSRYYFENNSTRKKYELDLLLLNQKDTKYTWKDIRDIKQKETFEFDKGLKIKGTVNNNLTNKEKSKVILLTEHAGMFSEINDKNEFYFENVMLNDAEFAKFSLIDHKNQTIQLKGYAQILNNRRRFNKPLQIKSSSCAPKFESVKMEKPIFAAGAIDLDAVEIQQISTPPLKHGSESRNRHMKGFKIGANEEAMTFLDFIKLNGFDTEFHGGHYHIYSRRKTVTGSGRTPAIFINNTIADIEMVVPLLMRQIDEIYLDNSIMTSGIERHTGIIKIYMKTQLEMPSRINYMKFNIEGGFANVIPFKNTSYASTDDLGFKNFGLIDWIPSILTNEAEDFTFQIPNKNQKKIKLLIEGFSSDGKLISEVRTIEVQ